MFPHANLIMRMIGYPVNNGLRVVAVASFVFLVTATSLSTSDGPSDNPGSIHATEAKDTDPPQLARFPPNVYPAESV